MAGVEIASNHTSKEEHVKLEKRITKSMLHGELSAPTLARPTSSVYIHIGPSISKRDYDLDQWLMIFGEALEAAPESQPLRNG